MFKTKLFFRYLFFITLFLPLLNFYNLQAMSSHYLQANQVKYFILFILAGPYFLAINMMTCMYAVLKNKQFSFVYILLMLLIVGFTDILSVTTFMIHSKINIINRISFSFPFIVTCSGLLYVFSHFEFVRFYNTLLKIFKIQRFQYFIYFQTVVLSFLVVVFLAYIFIVEVTSFKFPIEYYGFRSLLLYSLANTLGLFTSGWFLFFTYSKVNNELNFVSNQDI